MNDDEQHLRLLSIFHYVVGALIAFFACVPIIHLVIGILLLVAPQVLEGPHPRQQMPPGMPVFMGVMFTVIPAILIVFGWCFAACVIVAGRSLARHRRYTFCLVMAGFLCFFMPFRTVLGVFTIIVLMRPSVKWLFGVSGDLGGALQQNQAAPFKP
jgi:hypothetical protein